MLEPTGTTYGCSVKPTNVGGVAWFSPKHRRSLGLKDETYDRGLCFVDGPTFLRWGPSLGPKYSWSIIPPTINQYDP